MLTGAVNQNNMHEKVTQQTVNLISVFIYMQPTSPPQRGGGIILNSLLKSFLF